jgi:hypothetical protein
MPQVIILERNINDSLFLCIERYEYGTNKEFKTFTQATRKAQKDYKVLSKIYLERSLKETLCVTLRIKDSELIYNTIKFVTL